MQDSNQPAIWVPVLIFTNTANSDHTIMDSKSSLTVEKVSNYTKSTLDQLEEVAYYEGKENPVTFRRMYKKEFSCNFQLYFYPFDSQVGYRSAKYVSTCFPSCPRLALFCSPHPATWLV